MKVKKVQLYKTVYTPDELPQTPYNEVAFVGRSNVGKSSLLNAVANNFKLAKVSSQPGKTRSINFYLVNDRFFLVDLPGYGFAKVPLKEQQRWRELIESYLKGRDRLKGVFLLVDSKVGPTEKDLQMKEWLDFFGIPYTVVATKVDRLKASQRRNLEERIKKALGGGDFKVIPFSAKTREGREVLLREIFNYIES
ncbi:ribosome biogenesis GTP-binding protein YsxC [Thermovibrio ammonificans HB-1]|uniref:Probable GTP-binding protein EngB n=1 Tax=Thermovibrio ammonificans (strain DSM 15698 / JCM 12110 / HB-1) TaxID=648996 RepID=E8T4A4_THEA1|nr:ribosome biogenesis GTP-binding protein YihA/YsxC [Thermovibrio ammonificans]ADU97433.1 ribosome biogenesis GTP-binding protein YsxC [Thermovibrio ammonificans HB-1]